MCKKTPLFRVKSVENANFSRYKSVKIYTGQKNLHWRRQRQLWDGKPWCILWNSMKFYFADLSIYGERVFDSLPSLHWFLPPCLSNPRQSLTLRDIPPNSLNYWPPLTEKGDTSPQLNIVKRQILTCFVCKSWAKFTNVARMTKFEC